MLKVKYYFLNPSCDKGLLGKFANQNSQLIVHSQNYPTPYEMNNEKMVFKMKKCQKNL